MNANVYHPSLKSACIPLQLNACITLGFLTLCAHWTIILLNLKHEWSLPGTLNEIELLFKWLQGQPAGRRARTMPVFSL